MSWVLEIDPRKEGQNPRPKIKDQNPRTQAPLLNKAFTTLKDSHSSLESGALCHGLVK